MAQKGKKRLLRKLLIFIALFLVINEGIQYYFFSVTLAEDELFAQDAAFEAAPDTINFLFMGHSRPLAAVDADLLPRCFNYASDGEYNIYTYYKLKYILEETDKVIGTIVLPAGYGSFQSMEDAYTYRSYYWSQYVDYLEVGKLKDDYSSHAVIWFENAMFPYARHFGRYVDEEFGETPAAPESKPFSEMSMGEKQENAEFMLKKNEGRKQVNSELSLKYLQMTLDLCKKHKKAVYFISYPVTDIYNNAMHNYLNESPIEMDLPQAMIDSADGPFIGFEFDHMYLQDHNLFKDAHHLNAQGKKEFTGLLEMMLVVPDSP